MSITVECTQCATEFILRWESYDRPSGGIYDVYFQCPECKHEAHFSLCCMPLLV